MNQAFDDFTDYNDDGDDDDGDDSSNDDDNEGNDHDSINYEDYDDDYDHTNALKRRRVPKISQNWPIMLNMGPKNGQNSGFVNFDDHDSTNRSEIFNLIPSPLKECVEGVS